MDKITVILPDELENLDIEEGEDLVTLVTCTPYGVNTHRLLVRGHRIADDAVIDESTNEGIKDTAVSIWHSYIFMIFLVLLILIATILLLIKTWKKPKAKEIINDEIRIT